MANNNVRIENNELLQAGAYLNDANNTLMTDVIKRTILKDYQVGGVKSVTINLYVENIKNMNGVLVKNIKNGDIVQVGDVCVILNVDGKTPLYKDASNNPIYWKVVSRTFTYEAEPKVSLMLQEVKGVY